MKEIVLRIRLLTDEEKKKVGKGNEVLLDWNSPVETSSLKRASVPYEVTLGRIIYYIKKSEGDL